jgi:hypothetical protein
MKFILLLILLAIGLGVIDIVTAHLTRDWEHADVVSLAIITGRVTMALALGAVFLYLDSTNSKEKK